jgi:topoisomerase-4 subunit A
VKSFKVKGKRISYYEIQTINELEPTRFLLEPEAEEETGQPEVAAVEEEEKEKSNADLIDEITGQMKLFDE